MRSLKRHDEALRHFELALAQQPNDVELHNSLGAVLRFLDRAEQAVVHFRKAIALNPEYAEVHCNLGKALHELGRSEEACAAFQRAVALRPSLIEAQGNWGQALMILGRYAEAAARFEAAVALTGGDPEAVFNLGNALQALQKFDEAIVRYRQVLVREPNHGRAHYCLGIALVALNRNEEALRSYDRAIELMPDNDFVKWNKAHLSLALGQFEAGWELVDHRWHADLRTRPSLSQPRWDGGRVKGTLWVWRDQGLGDQILYSSMVPELAGLADALLLAVEPRLVPLFARSFAGVRVVASEVVVAAPPEPIAAQECLSDVGRYLRPDWQSFERREHGYLIADAARSRELRARLTGDGRRLIGLSWQSRNPKLGQAKTARLHDFASVLRIPNGRFIDLQYGDTLAEREAVRQDLGLQVERVEDVDNFNDIDALAALISACDLVLTVSNTTAHLSGALGKPTWVLVPSGSARFWYWFRDREDSPWYPRVRITRQARGQTWADLIAGVAPEIARVVELQP